MEQSISFKIGKGSIAHNARDFTASNVDSNRSQYNIEYVNKDLKQTYHELFDDAVTKYNARQTRSDRTIPNYYEKIRMSKQEKLFHEVIVQVGNMDTMNCLGKNGELGKVILDEYMKGFQERNPNLYVFSAHLHMDEQTPHLHIDFIPFTTGSKRGLETRVSLKQALKSQGFNGGSRSETEWNQWVNAEKMEVAKIMNKYEVKWVNLDTHNKPLDVLNFKKEKRKEEIIKSLEEVNLVDAKDKLYFTYSLGMKQKLGIAQVLMEDPEVMIFDEPFNGIERETANKLRKKLNSIKKNKIINIIKIVIPIIIVILAMLDLGKAVMAGEEKEIKDKKEGVS